MLDADDTSLEAASLCRRKSYTTRKIHCDPHIITDFRWYLLYNCYLIVILQSRNPEPKPRQGYHLPLH